MTDNSKTPKQLCAAHSFSLATFFRLVAAGKIEARKIGRKTIITSEAEKNWLDSLPRAGGAK